jgi:TRAP-type C4-dicarboxylate transport system permease small subunit
MVIYVAALLYFCTKLAVASWNNSIRTQGILRTPIFYPQLGMVVGLALMWISSLLVLVNESRALGRSGAKDVRP